MTHSPGPDCMRSRAFLVGYALLLASLVRYSSYLSRHSGTVVWMIFEGVGTHMGTHTKEAPVVGMAKQIKRKKPKGHVTSPSNRQFARQLLEPKTTSTECQEVASLGYN